MYLLSQAKILENLYLLRTLYNVFIIVNCFFYILCFLHVYIYIIVPRRDPNKSWVTRDPPEGISLFEYIFYPKNPNTLLNPSAMRGENISRFHFWVIYCKPDEIRYKTVHVEIQNLYIMKYIANVRSCNVAITAGSRVVHIYLYLEKLVIVT